MLLYLYQEVDMFEWLLSIAIVAAITIPLVKKFLKWAGENDNDEPWLGLS